MNAITKSILEILGIPVEDYVAFLHGLAEKWEDQNGLSGTFVDQAVRGWFVDMANNYNELFAEKLHFATDRMKHYLEVSNGLDHRFIFGSENMKPYFYANLQKLVKELNPNSAVAEFLMRKTKKVRS